MHVMNMWLTDAATVVVDTDWTLHQWRQNNVGVSLRVRCVTTLVIIM